MKGKRGQARGHKKPRQALAAIIPGTALLLTRISDPQQELRGHGSENQKKSGEEYASRHGFKLVLPPFQLVESAFDEDNRKKFDEFLADAERLGVEHLLFGRVDRALRNLFDLYRLEKMAREGRVLHLFQEGFVYHKNSPSGDFWRLGIQGVAAMGESRGNRERTRRILRDRALAGYWPGKAPFGYVNAGGRGEPKRIDPDPDEARWYSRIKQLSAEGRHSLDAIINRLRTEGCVLPLTRNLIERAIRSPFGAGRYQWEGVWVETTHHKPLVSWDLHLRAIAGLERTNKPKYRQHDWPYAGLIQCGFCSRAVVFEKKRKKLLDGSENLHVYAHCAGIRSYTGRTCPKCHNVYLKEPELERALGEIVKPISLSREIVDRILEKIAAGADEETAAKVTELATAKRELSKLATYIDRCYADKMENKISEDFWREQTRRWQEQRITLQERVKALEATGPDNYLALARKVLEPTISLQDKYFSMDPHKRATILRIVCSNLKQEEKRIVPTYRNPYGLLVRGDASGNWLRD